MNRRYMFPLLPLLLLTSTASAQQSQVDPVDTITIAELRDHIFWLASDDLEGRYTGSKGYEIAAKYCASQFAAAGLKTVITDAEGNPTYLQTVPISTRSISTSPVMNLKAATGNWEFSSPGDFKWAEGELYGNPEAPRGVVFVGYGIEEPDHDWNDFEGLDLKGKIVIMTLGAPMRGDEPVLPEELHNGYLSMPGLNRKLEPMLDKYAAAIMILADETLLAMWDQIPDVSTSEQMVYAEESSDMLIPTVMGMKPEMAEAMFSGQRYNPVGPEAGNLSRYRTFELEGVETSMKVEVSAEKVSSWNVVGVVEGTDPVLKNQYVAVTAHLDHLEPRDGDIMNGADDNASGCAGVMEIAEALAMNPPRRSVVFALFTKEEGGGIGSRHFTSDSDCPVGIESIVANLNLDMIGRTDQASMEDRAIWALNSDTETPELPEIIGQVNARTVNWPLKYQMPSGGFGSDDMMFRLKGIPAVFFFSGPHPDYHTPNDTADKIEYDKAQKVSQLVYYLALEIGNMDRSIRP